MSLNPFQRANFRFHTHNTEQVLDSDTGEPIDPSGGITEEQVEELIEDAVEPLGKRSVAVSVGDPNGAVLVAGVKAIVRVPFAWTDIESNTVVCDQSGTVSFTVRKAAFNVSPSWSSIVASAPPAVSGAIASTDATLTGWTKSGSAGDLLEIGVSGSPSGAKLAALTLVLIQA